jgi:hypothetical protein
MNVQAGGMSGMNQMSSQLIKVKGAEEAASISAKLRSHATAPRSTNASRC